MLDVVPTTKMGYGVAQKSVHRHIPPLRGTIRNEGYSLLPRKQALKATKIRLISDKKFYYDIVVSLSRVTFIKMFDYGLADQVAVYNTKRKSKLVSLG